MPELPDVEAHRRLAEDHAVGSTVRATRTPDAELLAGTTPQGLGRSLVGRTVRAASRHGKWLTLDVGGPRLLIHFRMTGELVWTDARGAADGSADTDAAVVLRFDAGELRYRTRRRLGRVHYLAPDEDPEGVTGPLGPDADDVDRAHLGELLADRRGGLKSALLDQELIAGLGNELVDDILWRARLHPETPARGLDGDELAELHGALREVLRRSIRAGHVPSGPTWLNAQRDQDDPRCPRCDARLERDTVAGRTTFWCPREQPRRG